MLGEAASLLYTGLGCARMAKKLLNDTPTAPHCPLEKGATLGQSHSREVTLPQEESTLSAAPSRRGSFEYRCSRIIAQQPDPWNVPACHACQAPITGALYMAFDRAYCGAAACHKAAARHCRPRYKILWDVVHNLPFILPRAGETHRARAVDAIFAKEEREIAPSKRR